MPSSTTKQLFDPSQTVDLQDANAVLIAISTILSARFGTGYDLPLLEHAIADLALAFRGDYPGLLRCDTVYHDLRHGLDSGLAMARLIDGQSAATQRGEPQYIDGEHALLGVLLAL